MGKEPIVETVRKYRYTGLYVGVMVTVAAIHAIFEIVQEIL